MVPRRPSTLLRSVGRVLAATIDTSPPLRVVRRDTLFADVYVSEFGTSYDIAPDGAQFLFSKSAEASRIIVALGWLDALRDRMARAGRN